MIRDLLSVPGSIRIREEVKGKSPSLVWSIDWKFYPNPPLRIRHLIDLSAGCRFCRCCTLYRKNECCTVLLKYLDYYMYYYLRIAPTTNRNSFIFHISLLLKYVFALFTMAGAAGTHYKELKLQLCTWFILPLEYSLLYRNVTFVFETFLLWYCVQVSSRWIKEICSKIKLVNIGRI